MRLSIHWAGSECQGAHQWKEKPCLQNDFSGHEILGSGYYPVSTFCFCVVFAEQWAQRRYSTWETTGKGTTSHVGVTLEASNPQHKLVYGVGISERVRKKSQESGVDVAGWKDFPRSGPLLAQPGHAGETGGSLQWWLISLFPRCWDTFGWWILIHHESHSCSITQLSVLAEEPEQICLYPFGTSTNSARTTRAQEQINCTNAVAFLQWPPYKPTPLHLSPLLLWGRKEEIALIWTVPVWLCRSRSLR